MRKTHIKLGLLIAMTCLFLAAGTFVSGGTASAQNVQTPKKFQHWSMHAPHITVKMLPNTAHHSSRAVIYGVGFDDCNSCASATGSNSPCGTGCNSNTSQNTTCSYPSCSTSTTSTNTTTTTTTTTSTNYTAPSPSTNDTTPSQNTSCSNSCSNTVPSQNTSCSNSCSNTVPSQNTSCSNDCGNTVPSQNTSCSDGCGNTIPSQNTSCPNDCGNTVPSQNTSCPNDCGNTVPSQSYNDCSCNTVNLQSSTPISASGINLSRVPVNAFGEFQVTVNVLPRARHHYHTAPTIWAINSYNEQPSNYASMCCSYTSCCQ